MGLPFFAPLFDPRSRIAIGGPASDGEPFGSALSRALRPPYFPLPLRKSPAQLRLRTLTRRAFDVGDVRVVPHPLNHPGGALGWRFYFPDGSSLVYVSDAEPSTVEEARGLIRWMEGADALIHDAQFGPKSYAHHRGWGHSPYTYPIFLAEEARVQRLFLFHFNPDDDDAQLARVLKDARRMVKGPGGLRIDLAREGMAVQL